MHYWDGSHMEGEWIMIVGFIAVVLVIAVGIYLLVRATSGRSGSVAGSTGRSTWASEAPRRSALDVLDSRYAAGEIDREDYLGRREDLLGHP